MMERITAVVVTYNRLELLKRVIDSLRNQTRKLDNIIVINNDSLDGTKEWLDEQRDLDVIHQANVGGSGGFYRGIEYAYEKGFDKIWCMDDDVFPKVNCLETLLKNDGDNVGIICPLRYINGVPFYAEVEKTNLSNIFKPLRTEITKSDFDNRDSIEIDQMAFEGPLISRKVVDKIGLPNKDLFIFYDDHDYSYRAVLAGFNVLLVKNAILDKYDFKVSKTKEEMFMSLKWKMFYDIRNTAYFCHKYGKNWLFRYFGGGRKLMQAVCRYIIYAPITNQYKAKDIIYIIKAYRQGLKHKLGKINL